MTDLVELNLFAQTLERLGVEPPAEFTRARSLLSVGVDTALANPVDSLAADFASGALTLEDFPARLRAAALELSAKASAHTVLRDLHNPLTRHATRAVRDDGDRLVHDLRVPFDAASKSMTTAGRLFDENATAEQVLALGAKAAAAWRRMAEDAVFLDLVLSARVTMGSWGYAPAPQHALLFTRVTSADALRTAEQAFSRETGPGRRWHALTAAGFALHLTTAAEIEQTQAALRAAAEVKARPAPPTPEQLASQRDWQNALARIS